MVVLLADENRKEIPDLEKIFVEGSGGRYSVANFATVERGTGPVTINREDQTRIIHLTANAVGESNAGEIENKIKSIIEENIVVPDGISLTFDGSRGNTKETGKVSSSSSSSQSSSSSESWREHTRASRTRSSTSS